MKSRLAILCPGQGAQHPGMFDLARTDRRAGTLLEQWALDQQLGLPLEAVLAQDAVLFSNRMAQPLIVAATLATWEAIKAYVPVPVLVAGYSIGEIAAHGVARTFSAEAAIRLAALRARLMDACLRTCRRQSLIAISGVNPRSVGAVLQQHQFHMAIETGEDSFIAGGPSIRFTEAARGIAALGGRVSVLPVEVASHTPLMLAAVAPFAAELRRAALDDPKFTVLSGISAEVVYGAEHAISALSRQIAETIQWKDCMDACVEAGANIVLELGPGSALSRMFHARHPSVECRSVAEFRTLDGIQKWLGCHLD
jgi:[acyl-carrier-protein] S-malonyltransferase